MNRWALLTLSTAALACTESVESSDIRTSGVYPEFRVVADGSGTSEASARLKVGGNDSNTFLDLRDGDRIEVSAGGETRVLNIENDHRYSTRFPIDAAGTEFVFAFIRSDQDESAPSSVVSLPEPFALAMAATEASRVSAAVGYLHWDVAGDCVWSEEGETPDDGSHSLGAEEVHAPASDETESCSVQLTARRGFSGTLDPAFTEGGENVAYQARAHLFTSTP
jgi:hypothetical protein